MSRRQQTRPPQIPADPRKPGRRGHGAKPESQRDLAVLALLSEGSIAKAAKKAGIDESTLRCWLSGDVEFQRAYDEARRQVFDVAISRLQGLAGPAVETLEELLGATRSPAVRLGAARTIAEMGLHQRDAEVILKKLDEIEAFQRTQGGDR